MTEVQQSRKEQEKGSPKDVGRRLPFWLKPAANKKDFLTPKERNVSYVGTVYVFTKGQSFYSSRMTLLLPC